MGSAPEHHAQCADIGEHVTGTGEGSGEVEPRATSAEEPEAGNPRVRIWRGAGMGNRPAYSTTAFATDGAPTQLPPTTPPDAFSTPRRAADAPHWAEARRLGIPINQVNISSWINMPDGSVDATVDETAGLAYSDLIKPRRVGYQIKADFSHGVGRPGLSAGRPGG
jgi:hypothetical protein